MGLACASLPRTAAAAPETPPRRETPLLEHWRFVQDDTLADAVALASSGAGWREVGLPHTWNGNDAASTAQTDPDSKP
jgi:beta-galactosidase